MASLKHLKKRNILSSWDIVGHHTGDLGDNSLKLHMIYFFQDIQLERKVPKGIMSTNHRKRKPPKFTKIWSFLARPLIRQWLPWPLTWTGGLCHCGLVRQSESAVLIKWLVVFYVRGQRVYGDYVEAGPHLSAIWHILFSTCSLDLFSLSLALFPPPLLCLV